MNIQVPGREELLFYKRFDSPKTLSLGRLLHKAADSVKMHNEKRELVDDYRDVEKARDAVVPYLVQLEEEIKNGNIPPDEKAIYEKILSYSKGMIESELSKILDNKFIFLPEVDRGVDTAGLVSIVESADNVRVNFRGKRNFEYYSEKARSEYGSQSDKKIDKKNRAHIRDESEFKDMDDKERASFFIRHMDLLPVDYDYYPTVHLFEVSHKRKQGFMSIIDKINFSINWEYCMGGNNIGYWKHQDSVEIICGNNINK